MAREVLSDCHSEQVRALVEEHNVMVEALQSTCGQAPPYQTAAKNHLQGGNKGMKKFSLVMLVGILLTMATTAFAFKGEGAGPATFGTFGGAVLYAGDFAPDSVTVIDMGTKGGYTNVAVDKLTKYQFALVKLSDNTAVTCSARFGGYSSVWGTTATGAFVTSGAGPWVPGNGMKRLGVYGCASSAYAARPQLVIYKHE